MWCIDAEWIVEVHEDPEDPETVIYCVRFHGASMWHSFTRHNSEAWLPHQWLEKMRALEETEAGE
jgi:hypothetical protein